MDYKYDLPERFPYHILSMPLIYGMIIPIVFLDVCIELYHRVCFPLYGLPYVERGKYIRIDRHRLSYLRIHEKLNCVYCGYANGLFYYASRIAGDTEHYWCAIKHAKRAGTFEQPHHKDFIEYGNEEQFVAKYKNLAKKKAQDEQRASSGA